MTISIPLSRDRLGGMFIILSFKKSDFHSLWSFTRLICPFQFLEVISITMSITILFLIQKDIRRRIDYIFFNVFYHRCFNVITRTSLFLHYIKCYCYVVFLTFAFTVFPIFSFTVFFFSRLSLSLGILLYFSQSLPFIITMIKILGYLGKHKKPENRRNFLYSSIFRQ